MNEQRTTLEKKHMPQIIECGVKYNSVKILKLSLLELRNANEDGDVIHENQLLREYTALII